MNDEEDDEDEEGVPAPTEAERAERMARLVPPLADDEWGRRSTAATTSSLAQPAPTSKASATMTSALPPRLPEIKSAAPHPESRSRLSAFEKVDYDGVASDSESEDEGDDAPAPRGSIGRTIADMKWSAGASRKAASVRAIDDGDVDEDEKRRRRLDFDLGDDELESVVQGGQRFVGPGPSGRKVRIQEIDDEEVEAGTGDVDMGEEEEEFLKFSREVLGINDEMWKGILSSREARGGE